MSSSKKETTPAQAEAPAAEEVAASAPEDDAGVTVKSIADAVIKSTPPAEHEPLAAVVGYTTVVPVPGSDGPRSQQELDAQR